MKDALCSMKFQSIGDTQFFSEDVRQRMKSVLHQSLQKTSGCCLRQWHVNGWEGGGTQGDIATNTG